MTILQTNVAELLHRPPVKATPEDEHTTEYAPNGDPVLSPSQVSTYLLCPRKWAARYLLGQHEPVKEGTLAGKRMHKLLELYYTKGIVPSADTPEGVWALALIRNTDLPIPRPGATTPLLGPVAERRFKFEYGGVWWRGSKDLVYMREGRYIIRDHKSTSELNPLWIKSEEQLRTDPQSVIYAFEAYITDDPDEVENEWGYVTRDKYPKTEPHRCRMTWDVTEAGMEYLTRVGLEILKLYRSRPGLNDLPPVGTTNGGCEAFSGCMVRSCNVTALDRIKGLQLFNARKHGGTDMNYIEQLKARQAAQAALTGGTTASAPAPAPAPSPAPSPAPADGPPAGDIRSRLNEHATGAGANVAPPPYTPPAAETVSFVANAATPPTANPVPTPRATRGRKRNQAAPAPSLATPPPVPSVTPRTARMLDGPEDGYHLCINCAPMGVPLILFSQYAAEIHAALKESKGWAHYNLASFDGKAAFQDALQQYLEQSPPVGYLFVDSRTDEGRDALPTLERYAAGPPFRGC